MSAQNTLDQDTKGSALSQAVAVGEPQLSDPGALPDAVAKELVQLFKLFSDETRLRVLNYLMHHDELNVRTLCEMLDQSQPAVSHHLALLRVAGLIECRRDGKHNYYHVMPARFKEFVEMIFRAEPNQASRICFETFTLNYQPAE